MVLKCAHWISRKSTATQDGRQRAAATGGGESEKNVLVERLANVSQKTLFICLFFFVDRSAREFPGAADPSGMLARPFRKLSRI